MFSLQRSEETVCSALGDLERGRDLWERKGRLPFGEQHDQVNGFFERLDTGYWHLQLSKGGGLSRHAVFRWPGLAGRQLSYSETELSCYKSYARSLSIPDRNFFEYF